MSRRRRCSPPAFRRNAAPARAGGFDTGLIQVRWLRRARRGVEGVKKGTTLPKNGGEDELDDDEEDEEDELAADEKDELADDEEKDREGWGYKPIS